MGWGCGVFRLWTDRNPGGGLLPLRDFCIFENRDQSGWRMSVLMKPYNGESWYRLEQLDGDVHAEGDTWRKCVEFMGKSVLLVQKGAWCGVRQEAYELESPEEVKSWRSL